MSESPISLRDETGIERFRGTQSPAGGGGSRTYEGLTGAIVNIANNAVADLDWGASIGPDTLLDLTDPTLPTVLADGLYLVQAFVAAVGPVTAGGQFAVGLNLDVNGAAQTVQALTPAATANGISQVFLPFTWFVPAGGVLECYVSNGDGVNAVDFQMEAFVIKVG